MAVLIAAMFLLAMSDSLKEEPNNKEITVPKIEMQKSDGFITQEELNNIAINYYKYMFEEEHEWKGTKRKEGEELIRSIVRFKADTLTLAYMVSFYPEGNVMIFSNKNFGPPTGPNGSGVWYMGVKEGEISIFDESLNFVIRRMFRDLLEDIKSNNLSQNKKYFDQWVRFIVPPEEFHERTSFDDQYPPPEWWVEKKSSKAVKILKE